MTHAFPIFLKLKLRTIFSVVTTGTGRSTHRAQRTSVSTRGDVSLPWAVVEFTRYAGTPIFRWLAKITTGLSKCRQVITVRSPAHVVRRAARRRRSAKIQNDHDVRASFTSRASGSSATPITVDQPPRRQCLCISLGRRDECRRWFLETNAVRLGLPIRGVLDHVKRVLDRCRRSHPCTSSACWLRP